MMICLKHKAAIIFLAAATALASACTKVDDTLGVNFIPDNQQMSTHVYTIGEKPTDPTYIETRLRQQVDSIRMSNIGSVFLGSRYSPELGYTVGRSLIQPVPVTSASSEGNYFGEGAICDSLYLDISVSYSAGNVDVEQGFTIYEADRLVKQDSIYDGSFDIGNYYDDSKPLFYFKHKGAGHVSVRLDDEKMTPYGQDYIDRLMETGINYEHDTVFIKGNGSTIAGFKGLVIVPDAKTDAGLYCFASDYENYGSAFFLYTHKPAEKEGEADVQTSMAYMFNDLWYYSSYGYYIRTNSTTVNAIEHDYASGSAGITPFINEDVTVGTAYIDGLGGVFTELQFTQTLRDELERLAEGENMAINNATVYFELDSGDPDAMDRAFTRLGMLLDYPSNPIPDYNYRNEENYGYTYPYGGYMNRTAGYYSMDITSYIQKWMADPEYKSSVSLAPATSLSLESNQSYWFKEVALKGSARPGYRIKLKLTYTLIP